MTQETFGFIGLGLIGGSLAKALKRSNPSCRIMAYSRTSTTTGLALSEHAIDICCTSVSDPQFAACDCIFLCAPVDTNISALRILKDIVPPDCILTDVGSVKTDIHRAAQEMGLNGRFIGGHPMTGSEKSGFAHAQAHLFENSYYIITPSADTVPEKIDWYKKMVTGFGALPIVLNCEQHDYATAAISHLPHLIAAALVNTVHDLDSKDEMMKLLAAGGFKDITRIASSSPEMWEQICMTNVEPIADMLERYIGSLQDILSEIKGHQGDAIYKLFEKSRDYRNTITDRAKGSVEPSYAFSVDVADEVGAISTIAVILAAKGISIKNIGINNNRERGEGALKIEFYDETSMTAAWKRLEYYKYEMVRL